MTAPVYGCHNRREYLYWVQTAGGYGPEIPFTMTRDCQYTKSSLGQTDPKCTGCSWRVEIHVKEERNFFVFRDWKQGDPETADMIQASIALTRTEADRFVEVRKNSPVQHYIVQFVKG